MNINVEQHPYRLTFTDETREGVDGDFDPNDPKDEPRMRFDLDEFDAAEDDWVPVDARSYCTQVSARLPKNELEFAARLILRRFISARESGSSAKRAAERLSWISTSHVQRSLRNELIDELTRKYDWDSGDIYEGLLDFIANRGLFRSLRNYLDDIGQEQQARGTGDEKPASRAVLPVPCGGEQYYEVQLRRCIQQTATVIILAPTNAPYGEIGDITWKNEAGDAGWQDNLEAGAEPLDPIVVPASSEAVRTVADVYGRICEDGHFERVFTE